MVHAFIQLMHNKSHEITHLYCNPPCVASLAESRNSNQRGLKLSGSVHEEAHRGLP